MNSMDILLRAYERELTRPWSDTLAGAQRVWFALYAPRSERRLRAQLSEFALLTRKNGHDWHCCDLTHTFARWMSEQEYREAYFEDPEYLSLPLQGLPDYAANEIIDLAQKAGPNDVVAVSGVASLFGFARLSTIVEEAAPHVKGRLLVFFPGDRDGSNYRLLDARDGWNYHAVPIGTEGH